MFCWPENRSLWKVLISLKEALFKKLGRTFSGKTVAVIIVNCFMSCVRIESLTGGQFHLWVIYSVTSRLSDHLYDAPFLQRQWGPLNDYDSGDHIICVPAPSSSKMTLLFLHLPPAESRMKQNIFDAHQEIGQWRRENMTADCFSPVVPLSRCHMTSSDREVVRRGAEWHRNRISLVI